MTYRWAMLTMVLSLIGLFALFMYIASTEPIEDMDYPTFVLPELLRPAK